MSYKQRQAQAKAEREAERRAEKRPKRVAVSRHVCNEDCEHYRSPLEQEIERRIEAVLKDLVPPGARAVAGFEAVHYSDPAHVKLVCSGAVPITAYYCVMKPKHSGQCWCLKAGYFTPEVTP